MATRLTKKQQTQLNEKLTGIIQKNNALQLRLSADRSVNEMNVNQISGALNRIHGQAIGKELPTEINIPIKQLGSGDPSPDNVRPFVGYVIDGIGTIYTGNLNIDTRVLTLTYSGVDLGTIKNWSIYGSANIPTFYASSDISNLKAGSGRKAKCSKYACRGWTSLATRVNNTLEIHPTLARPYISDSAFDNVDTFKASLPGVMLVYELETPETYTLTLQQMFQLLDQL